MSDSPHTSAPMVMRGRALVLKNTCRNASSTSVIKHLSWSPDIHPTARWVPSTPHRSRPAGYPPNRQPGAVGAKERECNVGHYVEADDEEETRPSAAVPPSDRKLMLGQPSPEIIMLIALTLKIEIDNRWFYSKNRSNNRLNTRYNRHRKSINRF